MCFFKTTSKATKSRKNVFNETSVRKDIGSVCVTHTFQFGNDACTNVVIATKLMEKLLQVVQ